MITNILSLFFDTPRYRRCPCGRAVAPHPSLLSYLFTRRGQLQMAATEAHMCAGCYQVSQYVEACK
jgi:hypothetical protein